MDQPASAPPDQQPPPPPSPAPSSKLLLPAPSIQAIKAHIQNHPYRRAILIVGGLIMILILAAVIKFAVVPSIFSAPKVTYQPVYTLVNEKISKDGAIVVNLPKGVEKAGAEAKVSFEPVIKGSWVASTQPDAIVYKPDSTLDIGNHYQVSFTTETGVIKKDFLVDENPAIVDVFPDSSAEADLASAITIVFNRPMVPLTTLSELDAKDIPVTIFPETPGKFKWISTRTLQFIPRTTLYGSAHYSVAISSNFVSMDGLSVPGKTYSFTTKQLRLDHTTNGTIAYNEPINFYFNEPIDLEKTTPLITVTGGTTPGSVPFTAAYGTSHVWDDVAGAYKDVEDRSIISIVPSDPLYGHEHAWDFDTAYTASIKTVYPIGGDITLTSNYAPAASASIKTSPIVKSLTAQSDNTPLASADLFDPAGTVTLSFYEDIDLGKSSIHAKGLTKVSYGKKCADTKSGDYQPSNCAQVDDKSTLVLKFDEGAYSRGEKVTLSLSELINAEGFQVNSTQLDTTLTVYPALKIITTSPIDGDGAGSISTFYFCTNVTLKAQEAKDFYKNFTTDKYIVFGRWDNAYLQTPNSYQKTPCADGTYVNRIRYGLLPLSSYSLSAHVEDVFGQAASVTVSLHTEDAPNFYLRFQNLQKIYNVTTPDKTTFTFATENFDYVNLAICKVSPDSMVRLLARAPSDTTTSDLSSLPCTATVFKTIPLKPDQWVNQYFQIDLKDYVPDPRGQYVLSFSNPKYTDQKGTPQYSRVYLSVTNLAVVDNRVRWSDFYGESDIPDQTPSDTRGSVYWLSRIHSLAPEAGALISIYQRTGPNQYYGADSNPPVLARSGVTGNGGFAEFPLISNVSGAAITSGDESAVISEWADVLSGGWQSAYQNQRVYIYTDRPIYRPGQQVFIKGLFRVDFDGMYQVFRDNDVTVRVSDSKGSVVSEQKVPVSAYGTFSADITLPAGAPLGSYSISALNQYASFDVQEYVGAAFEASAQSDKDEYVAGDTASISVLGKYYFGVPLNGATLNYSVTSQDFYFDRYTDEYFNFGGSWYNCYDCGYGDTYLKNGTATLNSDGTAHVDLPLDFSALFKGGGGDRSKIFVFHGTIRNAQGKSVSFQKSFIVHRGNFYLGVKADPSFTGVNQSFALRIKTVDTAGKPVSRSGIHITVNKVSWDSYKRQEVDGGFYNRPERTLTPVDTKDIGTDGSGNYSGQESLKDPGEYEIDATGKDSKGNEITAISEVYIYGQGHVDVQPTNNATLNLTAERTDLNVGDTAKFVIQNPYPHAKALITIERGRIFSYEVVDITQSIYEYQFPITEDHVPNVYASVVLLSPDPGVKYGQVEFKIDRKKKELKIDVQSDKKAYLPGEKVNLTVRTTDSAGNPVPADVSVAVADMSVLALKGNPKKNPLVFFYDGFPLTITAETNIKNLLEETPIPTGTKGGDGGNPADLATRKRGEFKDTAFWQAEVITNAQGVAQVSFTLPDNLTKWQVESVGITKDTKLGVQYQELVARKDVMTVPISPRFVVPGDEFMLGATIFNQTDTTQDLQVSIESKTLTIEDAAQTRKTVRAGESAAVYFKVKAPLDMNEGTHTFTLSAKNAAYNDTVELAIPITRNMTYESTATAGSSEGDHVNEYVYLPDGVLTDRGGITIKTSATLAVYLSDTLKYLFDYPYGCSEQLASKLDAIAIAKRSLSVPNVSAAPLPNVMFKGSSYTVDQAVDIGLNQIYDNQAIDGGFSYYKGLPSDPYLTMRVLNTFAELKKSGYAIRQNSMSQAIQYLYGQVSYFKSHFDTDTLIQLAYVLSRVDAGSSANQSLYSSVQSLATVQYMNDKASSNTLGYLALLTVNAGASQNFKDSVFATLINRVSIDSRGAYVKINSDNIGYSYYETPEKDTALLLKALVADTRAYSQTDKLLRWLLASRASDGSWGSTNTSIAAIDALADYLAWKRETESSFSLSTTLDGTALSSTDFTKQNILSTIETFLPIAKIELNKMHTVTFSKTNKNNLPNAFYYDMSLKYYLPVQQIAPRDEGVAISREFYSLTDTKREHPLASAKVGEAVRGVLTVISPKSRHLFSIEDYIPAGFELVNFDLATEDKSTVTGGDMGKNDVTAPMASSRSPLVSRLLAAVGFFGGNSTAADGSTPVVYTKFRPDFQELRDDRLFLFAQDVQPGAYSYEYYVRATTAGTFSHLPAIASDMYFPENFGRTSGSVFTVEQ